MISYYGIDGRAGMKPLWDLIDWDAHKQIVSRIQARIVKAVRSGLKEKVRGLQRLLANSLAAKLTAIKRVISNRGKRTPGIDGILLDTPEKRWETLQNLNLPDYKAKPLKRIYIPKKNGKKRPLGIPIMHDRIEQALDLTGLGPISETIADNHSYGFRKSRSAWDAIGAVYNALRRKGSADWILEADIKGCFDYIDHNWLMEYIPINKKKLEQWLKCGYLEKHMYNPTNEGTPQGGIISPTLANMALDGIQKLLENNFKRRTDKIHFIRYADDFIVTGSSKELLQNEVKPLIEEFLSIRGLTLSKEKTLITHIDDGFDFLGFNARKYKGKLLIKPAKSSIKRVKANVSEYLNSHKTAKTEDVIGKLNSSIRGWANYYKHAVSKKVFCELDHAFWKMTWKWARRRHPKKSKGWIKEKYFQRINGRDWRFMEADNPEPLFLLGSIPIKRHVKIKAEANPYEPVWFDYINKRSKRNMTAGCFNYALTMLEPYEVKVSRTVLREE
ncbi:MAG: group II intron reverse transcriptase/maturase [Desulfobacterales bacterium]|nr:group II intron reverse transcriptase/maturase [Desulfobacterales bacterium]